MVPKCIFPARIAPMSHFRAHVGLLPGLSSVTPPKDRCPTPSTLPPSTRPPVDGMLRGFRSYRREPAMAAGPTRILPPRTRANPNRARPTGTFRTNDFAPCTLEPGPAATHRVFCTNEFNPCTPEPERQPATTEMHERTPAAHPNPNPGRMCTIEPVSRTPEPKAPSNVTSPFALTPPPAFRRTRNQDTPLPVRPRYARAPVLARPLLHRPAVCLTTVTTPSTPPSASPSIHAMVLGFSSYGREPAMPPGCARILLPRACANPSRPGKTNPRTSCETNPVLLACGMEEARPPSAEGWRAGSEIGMLNGSAVQRARARRSA